MAGHTDSHVPDEGEAKRPIERFTTTHQGLAQKLTEQAQIALPQELAALKLLPVCQHERFKSQQYRESW